MEQQSHAVILGDDEPLRAQLECWLLPQGWACLRVTDAPDLPPAMAPAAALVIISDAVSPDARSAWVAQIRALDGPSAGTPILMVGPPGYELERGASALLPLPLIEEEALAIMAQWAGPLTDHAFRKPGNPLHALVRLAGQAGADRLLARFADQLDEAVAYLDNPTPGSPVPHQIAGLSGMLGFQRLCDLWRGIDNDDSVDLPSARDETSAVITAIRSRSSSI